MPNSLAYGSFLKAWLFSFSPANIFFCLSKGLTAVPLIILAVASSCKVLFLGNGCEVMQQNSTGM